MFIILEVITFNNNILNMFTNFKPTKKHNYFKNN